MSYFHEYLDKMQKENLSILDLQQELSKQLGIINNAWECYSFIFSTAMNKDVPGVSLNSDDFQMIFDMLRNINHERILVILQTPGGCGQTAERIAKYLHKKFKEVHFLISGEALSAGAILALSGHEILMTENGSLGPIDAQMSIGRSWVSAHDYITWIDNIRKQVDDVGGLHPVDATILAQITPGEIEGVHTALNFAISRVEEWLEKYKFRSWNITESNNKTVTPKMKRDRAHQIAEELTNQQRWRSHGTRLTIEDLEGIGLKVIKVEDKQEIREPVSRAQALTSLIFAISSIFKMYVDVERRVNRQATSSIPSPQQEEAGAGNVSFRCERCGKEHVFFVRFDDTPETREELEKNRTNLLPPEMSLTCPCGHVIDLVSVRSSLESRTGKKIIDDYQHEGA